MDSKPYTGKASGMKSSPWLASEDLSEGDAKFKSAMVKISGVHENHDVKLGGGRSEKLLFSVSFAKIPKQMILNATNKRMLTMEFGNDTKKWIGKEILLTVDTEVRFGNKITNGLRFSKERTRDLNSEIGLSDDEPPAGQAKPATSTPPPADDAEEVEVEVEAEENEHGDA